MGGCDVHGMCGQQADPFRFGRPISAQEQLLHRVIFFSQSGDSQFFKAVGVCENRLEHDLPWSRTAKLSAMIRYGHFCLGQSFL